MTTIVVSKPTDISNNYLQQIVDLVVAGGQIQRRGLREKILQADYTAFKLQDKNIICTATLKNPKPSYRTKIFNQAKVMASLKYEKELGYIVTNSDFEGNGHCKDLLKNFIPKISNQLIFATTRKPSMVHILAKFGFHQTGKTYYNDLQLLTNTI